MSSADPTKIDKQDALRHETACARAGIPTTGPHNRAQRRSYLRAYKRLLREETRRG